MITFSQAIDAVMNCDEIAAELDRLRTENAALKTENATLRTSLEAVQEKANTFYGLYNDVTRRQAQEAKHL